MYDEMMLAYAEAFPSSKLCILEPDGRVIAIDFDNEKEFEMPEEEMGEQFYDRIQRSKECGKNLFFLEWPVAVQKWRTNPDYIS